METALCNDATHGSIIIETIMGLDSNTGVLWVGGLTWHVRSPMIHLSAQGYSAEPQLVALTRGGKLSTDNADGGN